MTAKPPKGPDSVSLSVSRPRTLKIWIDGAGALLDGQVAKTCVIVEDGDVKVTRYGRATNNEMEYTALIHALPDPRSEGAALSTDSRLRARHVPTGWKVRAQSVRSLHD